MMPQPSAGNPTRQPHRWRAFSLAELMIAFAVLAMGLLVIGAALPIGVQYTKQSADLATGEAAAEYALDLIEQSVVLPRRLVLADEDCDEPRRRAVLFAPRRGCGDDSLEDDHESPTVKEAEAYRNYEPLIKVRPLYTTNYYAVPGDDDPNNNEIAFNYSEAFVYMALTYINQVTAAPGDLDPNGPEFGPPNWWTPAMSFASRVYPPVAADGTILALNPLMQPNIENPDPFKPASWKPDSRFRRHMSREEITRAMQQRTAWTAFYRRVSYGPNSDPALYEFVVVVTKRPSENHRYPLGVPSKMTVAAATADQGLNVASNANQGSNEGSNAELSLGYYNGDDVSTPIPWLVRFEQLPSPPLGFENDDAATPTNNQVSSTLSFRVSADLSALFPVGAVFLPARNDDDPYWMKSGGDVGLGPRAPTALPVYEVIERPDDTTVVTAFNGFYPRATDTTGNNGTPDVRLWPVWVVPPTVTGSGDNLEFSEESPVVAVSRRYIRVRELP